MEVIESTPPHLLYCSPLDPFRGSSWWDSVTNASRVTRTLGSLECLFATVFSSSWNISLLTTNLLNFVPTIVPYLPVESFHCSSSLYEHVHIRYLYTSMQWIFTMLVCKLAYTTKLLPFYQKDYFISYTILHSVHHF